MPQVQYDQAHDNAHTTALWAWWITAGLIGVLALAHGVEQLLRPFPLGSPTALPEKRPTKLARILRALAAMSTIWRRELTIRTLPAYLYRSPTMGELAWTGGYIALLTLLTLFHAHESGVWNYQDAMGYMVFAQFPLIIGLAGKNNFISYLTGVSYERLNFLHRVSGRMAVIWSWVHTLGRLQLGLQPPATLGSARVTGGIFALVAITVVEFTSERPIRKRFYEFFIVTHILFVLMLIVGAWIHHPEVAYWIYAGFILWSLDRIASLARLVRNNRIVHRVLYGNADVKNGTIELLGRDILRITVRNRVMSWHPGQHAYISCPALGGSWIEQHPFSIVNVPATGAASQELLFLCRVQNGSSTVNLAKLGFSKRVRDSLQSDKQNVPISVEGPYGTSPRLDTYDTVVLIAGGVGITWAFAHFLGIVSSNRPLRTRCVRLVWCTKDLSDLAWIRPTLEKALATGLPCHMNVQLDIFVTHSSRSDDPGEDDELEDSPEDFPPIEEKLDPAAYVGPPTRPPLRTRLRKSFTRLGSHSGSQRPVMDSRRGHITEGERPASAPGAVHVAAEQMYVLPQVEVLPFNGTTSLVALPTSLPAPPPPAIIAPSYYLPPPGMYVTGAVPREPASDSTLVSPAGISEVAQEPPLPPYLSIHDGRADICSVLARDIDQAHGGVHVSVCGPSSLASEVRRAVGGIMDAGKVLKGEQHSITLHCENFGW